MGSKSKRALKIGVIVVFVGFVGIQFIPSKRNLSDTVSENDFVRTFKPPDQIQKLLKTSCYDCHSNNTRYPWYNKLQPAAWFMEGHIKEGKEELNFSEFGGYSKRRQRSKLKSIISQTKSGEMPIPSYTYVHWDAILSEQEKKMLEDWITGVRDGS